MHAQLVVIGNEHRRCRAAPCRYRLRVDTQVVGTLGVARGGVRGGLQILLGHQIGVDVVVGQGAVLVWPRHYVDAETTLPIVMAKRAPQARRVDEELESNVALEG